MNNRGSEFTALGSGSRKNVYTAPPSCSNISKLSSGLPSKEVEESEESEPRVSKYSETPTPTPSPLLSPAVHSDTTSPSKGGTFMFVSPADKFSKSVDLPSTHGASAGTTFIHVLPAGIGKNPQISDKFSKLVDLPSTRRDGETSTEHEAAADIASGVSADQPGMDPNLKKTDQFSRSVDSPLSAGQKRVDPNLKKTYRQKIHITNQQRQSYGKNILARYPSIDGSKSKYLPNASTKNTTRQILHVLPKPSHKRTSKEVLELDAELGSSQC